MYAKAFRLMSSISLIYATVRFLSEKKVLTVRSEKNVRQSLQLKPIVTDALFFQTLALFFRLHF